MLSPALVIASSFAYLLLLFAVAWLVVERCVMRLRTYSMLVFALYCFAPLLLHLLGALLQPPGHAHRDQHLGIDALAAGDEGTGLALQVLDEFGLAVDAVGRVVLDFEVHAQPVDDVAEHGAGHEHGRAAAHLDTPWVAAGWAAARSLIGCPCQPSSTSMTMKPST